MSKYRKNIDDAFMECYCLLYENSTPKGDFKLLMDNAELNEFGQKVIPFQNYFIELELFDKIVQDTIKKFKIKKYDRQPFSAGIHLGCSPTIKKQHENE